jgi:hypothetical protein
MLYYTREEQIPHQHNTTPTQHQHNTNITINPHAHKYPNYKILIPDNSFM